MAMADSFSMSNVEAILKRKVLTAGQKLLMIGLSTFDDGCTIYDLIDVLGHSRSHRKTLQRQFDYLIAKGYVRMSKAPSHKQGGIANIYRIGKLHDQTNHQGPKPASHHSVGTV
jgi:hypothetical protein